MKLFKNFIGLQKVFTKSYSKNLKKEFDVQRYGILKIKHKGLLNILPIDSITYPQQNVSHIICNKGSLSEISSYDFDTSKLSINCLNTDHSSELTVQTPIKYNIEVFSLCGRVNIKDFENEFIKTNLKDTSCTLSNIKTNKIDIQVENGNVDSSKNIHANGKIHINGKGNMKLDQLVGESFNLNVKEGDVKIKSLYVVDSNIDVENGDLTIKQVHQNCNINIQNGNLDIGSLDGNLKATVGKGNVHLFASQTTHIELVVKEGDVNLSLPYDHQLTRKELNLSSPHQNVLDDNKIYQEIMSKHTKPTEMKNFSIKCLNGKILLSLSQWADVFLKMKS